ncbi:MAG: beta-ketoacyl-ACP synthase II [Peptococcaceae bacterium]|nr:beta-ketoacyl-ACP synthase II [Peptococcaceae bacterium]
MKRRVVITGMAATTPVGTGLSKFWAGLSGGKSGIGPVERFDVSSLSTRIAGEVRDFEPLAYIEKKELRHMDRFTQFAVVCAHEALKDAGADPADLDRDRVGVILGSGIGGCETFQEQCRVLFSRGPGKVSPFFVPMMISNMGPGQITISLGFRGPSWTTVTACTSSSNAIGDAVRLIERGESELVIAGGSEAPVIEICLAGFCSMKAMSCRNEEPEKASRPFDAGRDGFVIAEGAGMLILEEEGAARRRGARIYAEIAGYGMSSDAFHIVAPDPTGSGAALSMRRALTDAGITPEQVDYINAHGTSTPPGDIAETTAVKTVFGQHAYKLAVSSTKSMTGHLLGAAGAVEAIACVLAIREQEIPPTINYEEPDPECDLDYVPNLKRSARLGYVLSNSFGFGGHNATLVFKRYSP